MSTESAPIPVPEAVNIWTQSAYILEHTPYLDEWHEYKRQLTPYLEWLAKYAPVAVRVESVGLQLADLCLAENFEAVRAFVLSLEADLGIPREGEPSALWVATSRACMLLRADPPPTRPTTQPKYANVHPISSDEEIPTDSGSPLPAGVPRAPRVDPSPPNGVPSGHAETDMHAPSSAESLPGPLPSSEASPASPDPSQPSSPSDETAQATAPQEGTG